MRRILRYTENFRAFPKVLKDVEKSPHRNRKSHSSDCTYNPKMGEKLIPLFAIFCSGLYTALMQPKKLNPSGIFHGVGTSSCERSESSNALEIPGILDSSVHLSIGSFVQVWSSVVCIGFACIVVLPGSSLSSQTSTLL
jgi:hypothetical protein